MAIVSKLYYQQGHDAILGVWLAHRAMPKGTGITIPIPFCEFGSSIEGYHITLSFEEVDISRVGDRI